MKQTLCLLMFSLGLFLGCGKEEPTEVSKLQSSEEETGNKDQNTPKAAPEKKPEKSGNTAGSGRRPGSRFGQGGRSNPFADLGVTASQQEKLDAAREDMVKLFTPLFANRDMPREEREAKMREIRDAYTAKLKEILTEEQFAKYEEAQANRGSRGQGRPSGRGDSLASLNLTEAQQESVTAIQSEQRAEQTKMFQELRANGGGFEGIREKMTALRAKYDQRIEALLTDEQKEKYKEIQTQRRQRGTRRPSGGGFSKGKTKGERK